MSARDGPDPLRGSRTTPLTRGRSFQQGTVVAERRAKSFAPKGAICDSSKELRPTIAPTEKFGSVRGAVTSQPRSNRSNRPTRSVTLRQTEPRRRGLGPGGLDRASHPGAARLGPGWLTARRARLSLARRTDPWLGSDGLDRASTDEVRFDGAELSLRLGLTHLDQGRWFGVAEPI